MRGLRCASGAGLADRGPRSRELRVGGVVGESARRQLGRIAATNLAWPGGSPGAAWLGGEVATGEALGTSAAGLPVVLLLFPPTTAPMVISTTNAATMPRMTLRARCLFFGGCDGNCHS